MLHATTDRPKKGKLISLSLHLRKNLVTDDFVEEQFNVLPKVVASHWLNPK